MPPLIIMSALLLILTFILFCVAIYHDVKAYRIPNQLCLTFILVGISANTMISGLDGFLWSVATTFMVMLLLFPLFALRMLGAGDVKLMMAVGALLGPSLTLWSLAWGIIAGGALTILFAAVKTGWHGSSKTAYRYFMCFCMRRYVRPEPDELAAVSIPYAPALAIGFVVTCFNETAAWQQLTNLITHSGGW